MPEDSQPEPLTGVARTLVERLEQEPHEAVGEGALTIDASAALRKLGTYQLSDPYTYVLDGGPRRRVS